MAIKRRTIDWSVDQSCVSCLLPMKKAGTIFGPGYVVHRGLGTCIPCVRKAEYEARPASEKRYVAEILGDTKRCKKCLEFLSFDQFYPSKGIKDGYSNDCRLCDNLGRHNLPKEKYQELLKDQNFSCAICKTHIDSLSRRLYVDHDHSCCQHMYRSCGECVRGLLCISCNSGIGLLKDSKIVVASALEYLTSRKTETNG